MGSYKGSCKSGDRLSPDITVFDALLVMTETHGASGGAAYALLLRHATVNV